MNVMNTKSTRLSARKRINGSVILSVYSQISTFASGSHQATLKTFFEMRFPPPKNLQSRPYKPFFSHQLSLNFNPLFGFLLEYINCRFDISTPEEFLLSENCKKLFLVILSRLFFTLVIHIRARKSL